MKKSGSKKEQDGQPPAAASRADLWAAIDVGSATIHLLVGALEESDGQPGVRHIESRATVLDLGVDVAQEGAIGEKAAGRIASTLTRYVKVAKRYTDNIVIAATEASRSASNRAQVLGPLSESIGYPVHLLSGRREAQLGFLGVQSSLPSVGCQVVIDSGGASTEVSVTDGRGLKTSTSIPLGAAVLGAGIDGDPPPPLAWALEAVRLGKALRMLPKAEPVGLWATGGSAHNLVGLHRSRRPARTSRLSMAKLERSSRRLLQNRAKAISKRTGEDPRRVKLLAPGALILGAIMQHYGAVECTVLAPGVRDGMILAAHASPDDWWKDAPARKTVPATRGIRRV
ncbi:MAG TPA: hypothetical protein VIK11_03155 [Tepidiformaceae bacterium]